MEWFMTSVFSTICKNLNIYRVASYLIKNCQSNHHFILIATHNLDSVLKAIAQMPERGSDNFHFAQLTSMGDAISLALVSNGMSCLKLLPVGKVDEVLPFLARRVQENADAFNRTELDRKLIATEVKRRMRKTFFDWKSASHTNDIMKTWFTSMKCAFSPFLNTDGFHSAALAIITLEAPVFSQKSLIPSWVFWMLFLLLLEPPLAITGILDLQC